MTNMFILANIVAIVAPPPTTEQIRWNNELESFLEIYLTEIVDKHISKCYHYQSKHVSLVHILCCVVEMC